MPREGLLVDIDYNASLVNQKNMGNYTPLLYAMDKHGNLYVKTGEKAQDYLVQGDRGLRIEQRPGTYMNRSSFLAGREAICAGYIHIGLKWDESNAWKEVAGHLSAIRNNSGHYQPSRDDLTRCILTLQQNGINVDHARVGFYTPTGSMLYSRGSKFLQGDAGEWDGMARPKPVWAPPVVTK
jgi:hypothetical protein